MNELKWIVSHRENQADQNFIAKGTPNGSFIFNCTPISANSKPSKQHSGSFLKVENTSENIYK